jgi:hypothetical protein
VFARIFFFLFILNSTAFATQSAPINASTTKKVETYQDLIEKAQNLSLQRDRLQATQILVRALEREKRGSKAYRALLQSLDQLAGLFYTEKAQKEFELAESLVFTKEDLAIARYQSAIAMEEGHLPTLIALAQAQLRSNECNAAATNLSKAEKVNPYNPETSLLMIRALLCLDKKEEALQLLNLKSAEIESLGIWALDIRIQLYDALAQPEKARTYLKEALAKDAKYPELHYWRWKLALRAKEEGLAGGQDYLSQCKSISFNLRRKYRLEPLLCSRQTLVANAIEEASGSEGDQ